MRASAFAWPTLLLAAPLFADEVYFNDFNNPPGTTYPEWTSTGYTNSANQAGTIAAGSGPQTIATLASANGQQRSLGESGGPVMEPSRPHDLQHLCGTWRA